MQIERVRQLDSSDPDESGMYDYHYEYDIYRFTEGPISFIARSYTDKPDEAHFLSIETDGSRRLLVDADLKHPLFNVAKSHLRSEGKTDLHWLSGRGDGYEPVPSGQQHGA
ncbi:hypothetical protein [Stenotrophomonas humi]